MRVRPVLQWRSLNYCCFVETASIYLVWSFQFLYLLFDVEVASRIRKGAGVERRRGWMRPHSSQEDVFSLMFELDAFRVVAGMAIL